VERPARGRRRRSAHRRRRVDRQGRARRQPLRAHEAPDGAADARTRRRCSPMARCWPAKATGW
jgi:hypothetical protein